MRNELHERLEYLVNYSSQLIFVSGDSIAEQQKTLEAFVFQQHDDTEIAYVAAQDEMDLSDYRRQLCRQLLGQVVGSFVRPLNELLSELNNHNGPILIAITQAHNLPDIILQELWDLVLQSRFAGNKQHLNVLLFANTAWAENAKQWLPAKNTETPLIISSQSVMNAAPVIQSDLDKMIASRREAFQAHLDKRKLNSGTSSSNLLKSRSLYVLIALVFISTFAGLIYWQYGDKLSPLFQPLEVTNAPPSEDLLVPGSAYESVANDTEGLPENQSRQQSLLSNIEIVQDYKEPSTSIAQSDDTSIALQDESTQNNTSGVLVTDWQSAISALPVNNVNSETQPIAKKPLLDSEVNSLAQSNTEKTNNVDTFDSENESVPPPSTEQNWINAQEFTIQLIAMKNKAVLTQYLNDHNLTLSTRIYETERYGGQWYVVVYNQTFKSSADARAAIKSLPDFPGKSAVFIKSGKQIIAELSRLES